MVPVHPGSPGKKPLNVCACVLVGYLVVLFHIFLPVKVLAEILSNLSELCVLVNFCSCWSCLFLIPNCSVFQLCSAVCVLSKLKNLTIFSCVCTDCHLIISLSEYFVHDAWVPSCAGRVQKSACVLGDFKAAGAWCKADSGPRQQVSSHVPLGRDHEDIFSATGLQSWWTAARCSCWLLGEHRCSVWFWSHNRHKHKLCVLPLKLDTVNSIDVSA